MNQIPILFVGDSPSLTSGLARIGRDLALHAATLPQLRVGYLGRGGIANRSLPFTQYTFQPTEEDQWGAGWLETAWRDFAGSDRGIIFTVWDPFRVDWIGNPQESMSLVMPDLYAFLNSGRFDLWGYFAVDGAGPDNGGLGPYIAEVLAGYDRVLAYTPFGADVLAATVHPYHPVPTIQWLPHGYHEVIFRRDMRIPTGFQMRTDYPIIGTVMTNQARKDWGVWAQTAKRVRASSPGAQFWIHTDVLEGHWSIPNILLGYGLTEGVQITTRIPDSDLAAWYSNCDVTFLPTGGEGFGYPILESLACGVPVVSTAHAAGSYWQGFPGASMGTGGVLRPDTRWLVDRATMDPGACADEILWYLAAASGISVEAIEIRPDVITAGVEHLKWRNLWPGAWRKWFTEGIGGFRA